MSHSPVLLPPAPAPAAARRKAVPRPTPVRSATYAHLSVDELRELRAVLGQEESRVSYWRRILQARLDVLTAGSNGRTVDPARLAPVLSDSRVGAGRLALSRLLPLDDEPPLPRLAELWERPVDQDDPQSCAELAAALREAEQQLSDYRASLHVRIGEATTDLIARYREAPGLCLSALPLPPERS